MVIESDTHHLHTIEETLNTTCFARKIVRVDSMQNAINYFDKIKLQDTSTVIPDLIFINEEFVNELLSHVQELEAYLYSIPRLIVLKKGESTAASADLKNKNILKVIKNPISPASLFCDELLTKLNY